MTSLRPCPRQRDVQQASVSGRWSASLNEHAASCAACRDVRLIAEAFAAAPAEPTGRPRIDPALLFARAREERRLRAEARVSLVTTVSQMLIAGSILAVLVAAVFWFLPSPGAWAQRDWSRWTAELPSFDPRLWLYGTGALLMAVLLLFARHASEGQDA